MSAGSGENETARTSDGSKQDAFSLYEGSPVENFPLRGITRENNDQILGKSAMSPQPAGRRSKSVTMGGMPVPHRDGLDEQHDHPPLLRFLILVVTARSAEGC